MTDPIHAINMIRDVSHPELRLMVKKVAVILTSPRSGSSLVKNVLASHPNIASLDGEIEPFLVLTRNGFRYNSDSDAIRTLANKSELGNHVFGDLTVCSERFPPLDFIKKRWEKRFLLQFPCLFSEAAEHRKLVRLLDAILAEISAHPIQDEYALQTFILSKVFKNEPWRINYYDGHLISDENNFFNERLKIEEPPFVVPRLYRRQFVENDAKNNILLFKTPPDAYRIGMYEQLFPNADIKYIHLTRGFAQSVNGLMDGWLSPIGFFSHDLMQIGLNLDIKGYSDVVRFGKKWWKFDLPPNWREFTHASLEDVCLNQWLYAHQAILASEMRALRISFEEFLLAPSIAINKITDYLGLPSIKIQSSLPVVMAIETPRMKRWKKREHQLLKLGERQEVREMMGSLGYAMNSGTWL